MKNFKRSTFRRIISGLMALLILSALATGCAGKAGQAPADKPAVKFGIFPMPTLYLMQVFQEMGMYQKNGANVEFVYFPVYSDCIQAFNTGKVDMIGFAVSESIAPAVNDIDCKVVGMFDKSNGLDGIVSTKDITSIEQLKGKTIATEIGTVDHLMLLKALEAKGLSDKDVNVINMAAGDSVAALAGKSIDAISTWEPQLSLAAKNGNLIYSTKENPDLISDIFLVRTSVLNDNYDGVKAILKTWYEGIADYQKDPGKYAKDAAPKGELTVEEFNTLMGGLKLTTVEDCRAGFEKGTGDYKYLNYVIEDVSKFLLANKLIEKEPTREQIDNMFDSRIINDLAEGK